MGSIFEGAPNITKDRKESGPAFTPKNFLEQIEKEKILYVEVENKGKKEKHEIIYTEINPERNSEQPPLLFVGGYNVKVLAYIEPIYHAVKSGRRVLFINPVRGFDDDLAKDFLKSNHIQFQKPLTNRASEVVEFMRNFEGGIAKYDVMGHSLGGAMATFASSMLPERIHNLVLDNPAGLDGKKNMAQMFKEYKAETQSEIDVIKRRIEKLKAGDDKKALEELQAHMEKWQKKTFKQKIKQTKETYLESLKSVYAISKADMRNLLKLIRKYSNSIKAVDQSAPRPKVKLLTGANDRMFTTDQTFNQLGGTSDMADKYVDTWVQYIDPDVGHGFWTKYSTEKLKELENGEELSNPNKQTQALLELLEVDFEKK